MFLGLNGVVVKSHGGTDAVGFAAAIAVAADLVRKGTNERIIEEMGAIGRGRGPGAQRGGLLTVTRRSVVRGVGAYLPARVMQQRRAVAAWSTPPTRGSASAPASASATSRPMAS